MKCVQGMFQRVNEKGNEIWHWEADSKGHSALANADEVLEIALTAPIYSLADYEATRQLLDEAEQTLLNTYRGGAETPGIPNDWKIEWYDCRIRLQGFEVIGDRLEQRRRASKFFAAQRYAEAKAKENAPRHTDGWERLADYDQYMDFKKQGYPVREIAYGRVRIFEYQSVVDAPRRKS